MHELIESLSKSVMGLGLMFAGVQMLSSALKQMGSRPFRMLVSKSTSSRGLAVAFGMGSGVMM